MSAWTKARQAQILALEAKASPGPWTAEPRLRSGKDGGAHGYFEITCARGMFWIARVLGFNAGDDVEKYKSNAAFIAASRSDVPDMAAHIEQLHAALAMRLLLGHNPACGWWCEPSEECDCGFDRITAIQKEYEGAEPAAESVPASAEVKLGMEFVPTRYFTSFGPARVTCPECGGSGFPSIFRTLSDPEAKP